MSAGPTIGEDVFADPNSHPKSPPPRLPPALSLTLLLENGHITILLSSLFQTHIDTLPPLCRVSVPRRRRRKGGGASSNQRKPGKENVPSPSQLQLCARCLANTRASANVALLPFLLLSLTPSVLSLPGPGLPPLGIPCAGSRKYLLFKLGGGRSPPHQLAPSEPPEIFPQG